MKNLQNFEEFLNEASSFDTKRTKHIKFILGSIMPYKNKSFYFNFRKGTDEKEIEEILKSAEKGNRDIAKITRKYGKNPTSGDTVLELSDLNYSGLTWIFKELDDLYGQKGSGMGWFGDIGESVIEESHFSFLGGNSNFTDDEMRKNVVDKVLGKRYDAYIMFDGPKGEYDKMKAKYAGDSENWEEIWRSQSYQSYARLSPDKKVIRAAVFSKGGIIGAIYVKK